MPDANTKDNSAQDDDRAGTATPGPTTRFDPFINGKKDTHRYGELTNPRFEGHLLHQRYTDTNVNYKFLVDPDHASTRYTTSS